LAFPAFAGTGARDCVHEDMTMKDGSKVMTDGTMMTKDGKKMSLKDGDMVAMDGTMTKDGMKEKEDEKK
jgi:hypothetical protein